MVAKLADQSYAHARLQKRDRLIKYNDIGTSTPPSQVHPIFASSMLSCPCPPCHLPFEATAVSSRGEHFFFQEVIPTTLPASAIAPARAKAKHAADEESAAVLAGTSVGPGAAGLSGPKPKGGRKGRPSAPKVMGKDALAGLGGANESGTGTPGGSSVAGDSEAAGGGMDVDQ